MAKLFINNLFFVLLLFANSCQEDYRFRKTYVYENLAIVSTNDDTSQSLAIVDKDGYASIVRDCIELYQIKDSFYIKSSDLGIDTIYTEILVESYKNKMITYKTKHISQNDYTRMVIKARKIKHEM